MATYTPWCKSTIIGDDLQTVYNINYNNNKIKRQYIKNFPSESIIINIYKKYIEKKDKKQLDKLITRKRIRNQLSKMQFIHE
jgi:hypothetical protein